MRSFPGANLARLALPLVLSACGGGESLPDDPRPPASAEALVPPAALRAVLAPAPPGPTATVKGVPLTAIPPMVAPEVSADPPALSKPGLPPEIVGRLTRLGFGRLGVCYLGLSPADPAPSGSVVVRYVIAADGSVATAHVAASTFTDPSMSPCVEKFYRSLSFPAPTGGPVAVTQKVYFAPASP